MFGGRSDALFVALATIESLVLRTADAVLAGATESYLEDTAFRVVCEFVKAPTLSWVVSKIGG
jgi:hypothetical protein